MTRDLVVVGAGGFGRETLDVVEAINMAGHTAPYRLLGVVDDAPSAVNVRRLAARGVPYCGGIEEHLASRSSDVLYALAVGRPQVRRALVERFDDAGHEAAVLLHPGATVGSVTRTGGGVIVCGGVQVSTNVELGRHVHLNPNATIGHDCVIEEFVSVNPAATISGECRVGSESLIGAAAVILQGRSVGAGSVVGSAACVTRDVADGRTVVGVPARPYVR